MFKPATISDGQQTPQVVHQFSNEDIFLSSASNILNQRPNFEG